MILRVVDADVNSVFLENFFKKISSAGEGEGILKGSHDDRENLRRHAGPRAAIHQGGGG